MSSYKSYVSLLRWCVSLFLYILLNFILFAADETSSKTTLNNAKHCGINCVEI